MTILVKKVKNNISTVNTSTLVKKTDYNTKINETENKITNNHDKYITTQEFNKLTSDNVATRLKQVKLASKNDIFDITVKKTDFYEKLNNLKKKITSNKRRHIEFTTKLNNLEKKVKIISTKGLTADFIKKYSILNGAKYFPIDGLQNHSVFKLKGKNVKKCVYQIFWRY